jgi:hypothetical protein
MRADDRSADSEDADEAALAGEAGAAEAEDVAVDAEDKLKRRPGLIAGRAIIEDTREERPSWPPPLSLKRSAARHLTDSRSP